MRRTAVSARHTAHKAAPSVTEGGPHCVPPVGTGAGFNRFASAGVAGSRGSSGRPRPSAEQRTPPRSRPATVPGTAKPPGDWRSWSTVVACLPRTGRPLRTRWPLAASCSTGSPATLTSSVAAERSLRPCTRAMTLSPARCSSALPRTRWSGAGPTGLTPCPWRDLSAKRFLPEGTFGGRRNARAPVRGAGRSSCPRRDPSPTCWMSPSWQADELPRQYAMYAAVACIRAAASRAGVPVRQECQDLDERPAPRCHSADFARLRIGLSAWLTLRR